MRLRAFLTWIGLSLTLLVSPYHVAADERDKAWSGRADVGEVPPEDEAELHNLLKILEEETRIATKSKINSDFVPGIVTVLDGDDLAARGVQTVWEALGLVPGIELSRGNLGFQRVVVRGVGRTFVSANMKILLNSISFNAAMTGTVLSIHYIPIDQVDRIEVVRGPGAALHGEFAYAGVVNVITRNQGKRLFGGAGSHDTYQGGGIFSWAPRKRPLTVCLNLSGWQSDGADERVREDKLFGMGMESISNAPGRANEDVKLGSYFFTVDYKNFSLLAQFVKSGHGDYLGVNHVLPADDDGIRHKSDDLTLEARQGLDLTQTLQAQLTLGIQNLQYKTIDFIVNPPGFMGIYPDGMFSSSFYEERKLYGDIDLTWKGLKDHTILLGWALARTELKDAWHEPNYHPLTYMPLPSRVRFEGAENWILEGKDRVLNSITLQDEVRLGQKVNLTAGFRYDHYNDVGSNVSPRLAVVFRLTRHHILKVQYAQAFRPPTFVEMYVINNPVVTGNPNIEPEIIDTYELGYIFKKEDTVAKVTLFYSDLEDLIVEDNGVYENSAGAKLMGVEMEFSREFGRSLKLDANLSFVDTEDRDTDEEIAGSANWLANFGLNFQPMSKLMFNMQYRYVGERNREVLDTRDDLEDYNTVNATVNVFHLGLRGLTLRGGIKNLFKEDVYYPAPLASDLLGNPIPSYPEDYPQPGRQYWIQFVYNF